jgi:hypothetical protein
MVMRDGVKVGYEPRKEKANGMLLH